jgi:hypothetical protein
MSFALRVLPLLIFAFNASAATPKWVHQSHAYCIGYCVKVQKTDAKFTDATLGIGVGPSTEGAFADLNVQCKKLYDIRGKQYRLNPNSTSMNSCTDETAEVLHGGYGCSGTCHLSDLRHSNDTKFVTHATGPSPALAYQNLVRKCESHKTESAHLFTMTPQQRISRVCTWHPQSS